MSLVSEPSYLTLQPRLEALILALYPKDLTTVSPTQADALFSRAIGLLPLLNNPLNIELLIRHTLESPAIWLSTGTDDIQRYIRILSGFRSTLGWKLADLKEGKGGLTLDEWVPAVGRGATGTASPWKHLFLFSGLRSAINEEMPVSKSTKRALEHAYVRAFSNVSEDIPKDIAEAILFTLSLMEHNNPVIVDDLLSMSSPEHLVLFLVDALYSEPTGLFQEIPHIISSLGKGSDVLTQAQQIDSHILQPHIPRISSILSRAFSLVRDPKCLMLGLDKILASAFLIRDTFSGLSEQTAQMLLRTDPSLSAKTDVSPLLWESLKRYLFATVMSLQGIITNLMHSRAHSGSPQHLMNIEIDPSVVSFEILEILGHLAFVSVRFGYSAFDAWNFVYLASIDILSAFPAQVIILLNKHIPISIPQHPSKAADALYFLDTLEHFISILPEDIIIQHYLPITRIYLSPSNPSLRRHLESAHSVFLAILARGNLLHSELSTYLTVVYSSFPQFLSPRQFRLAISTVIKLSPPSKTNEILTDLVHRAMNASSEIIPSAEGVSDEQLTYLFAMVDSIAWLEVDVVEFWLEQIVNVGRRLNGRRREEFVKRIWECVSGEVGGEVGMSAVEWWVNGGKAKVVEARL